MKKRLLNAMAIVMALGMVFMAGNVWAEQTSDNLELTFTLDNPPSVTISAVGTSTYHGAEMDMADGSDFNRAEVVHGQWEVNCNNAFAINFTGDSPEDDFTTNGNYGAPWFTKLDVNASGGDVTGQYDHLVTTYAVEISDEYSLEGTDLWGASITVPDGTPANLVVALDADNGPDVWIGRIMASDSAGKAIVNLYAKGVASQDVQSGDYTSDITLTVTLEEQGTDL